MRITFHPMQCLPPEPIVSLLCMWGLMGNIITHAQFQLNQFRASEATVTQISLFPISSDQHHYKQLPLPCYTVISTGKISSLRLNSWYLGLDSFPR